MWLIPDLLFLASVLNISTYKHTSERMQSEEYAEGREIELTEDALLTNKSREEALFTRFNQNNNLLVSAAA